MNIGENKVNIRIGSIQSQNHCHRLFGAGSSSFDLANKITEPLTGRNMKCRLFQLSYQELVEGKAWLWCRENMEELLIYGSYPGIIDKPVNEKEMMLSNL